MIATATTLYRSVRGTQRAIAGFNVFGYEDARAVIDAAESLSAPVMIMVNPDMVRHMPIPILGPMLRRLAEDSSVPVCVHLDHSSDLEVIRSAIEWGFSSVMYDGSHHPPAENCEYTREVVAIAHPADVSVEGEIGVVPYPDIPGKMRGVLTDPSEARMFVRSTGVDALAVSIGSVHRRSGGCGARIDFGLLDRIMGLLDTPLVIHGTTGISDKEIEELVEAGVCKFNIGTALRNAFARSIMALVGKGERLSERVAVHEEAMAEVRVVAGRYLGLLGW